MHKGQLELDQLRMIVRLRYELQLPLFGRMDGPFSGLHFAARGMFHSKRMAISGRGRVSNARDAVASFGSMRWAAGILRPRLADSRREAI